MGQGEAGCYTWSMNRKPLTQMWILFGILLADFLAQIPYVLDVYYGRQHPPAAQGFVIMGAVFAVFLLSYALLMKGTAIGYYLMLGYLAVEFTFYLWNVVGEVVHGFGLFAHLSERDPVLWVVFAIGYLSFFASGYMLFLLLYHRDVFLRPLRQAEG